MYKVEKVACDAGVHTMADPEIELQGVGPLIKDSSPSEDPNPKHRAPKQLYFHLSVIFICGILFAVTGWQFNSLNASEKTFDYTNCSNMADNSTACSEMVGNDPAKNCTCQIKFQQLEEMHWPVVMQYRITNFDPEHRRYNQAEKGTNHIFNGKCKRF